MSKVFVVCGAPGVGKTSYGKKLASRLGAVFLDFDTASEPIVQAALVESGHDKDDRDSAYYKKTLRDPSYQAVLDLAKENAQRLNVVIVGPFTKEQRIADWPEKIAAYVGAEVEVHYLWCSAETRKQRILQRGNPRDRAKLAQWEKYLEWYGREKAPDFRHIFIDTTEWTRASKDENLNSISSH